MEILGQKAYTYIYVVHTQTFHGELALTMVNENININLIRYKKGHGLEGLYTTTYMRI